MSGRGRPFVKGQPKRHGRKRGTPNKATTAYKDFLQKLIDDPIVRARMVAQARDGKLDTLLAVGDRVIGRPAVQIEIAGIEALADSYREALKAAQAAADEK